MILLDFDSGYSILNGHLPIRDFWIFTGLLVDYMEAIFIFIFGNNWNSHLAHGSFMNVVATLSLFFFLKDYNLKFYHIIIYSLSFATLCYPVSGTPFAYLHAYIFSLIAALNLIIAIKKKNNFYWFVLPIICFLAFLSMQTPTSYILLILAISIICYFLKNRKKLNLKYFIFGCLSIIVLFFLFLYFTKTPIINFVYQYILFPITIGEGRIISNDTAYIGLLDQLNLKRLFGEFKLIHIFLIPLIFISIKNFKSNSSEKNFLNLIIIFSAMAFLFNQIITANQTYIFSLIPVLAAILHINLINSKFNNKILYIIFLFIFFSTIKFHYRFNVDRKFHDLEYVDKSKAIQASMIHKNLKSLKWINKFDNPKKELMVLKQALKTIKNEEKQLALITHYQFMSTVLAKPLNILNRWYLWDNNTHPTENHKYFKFYQSLINKSLKNKVEIIYLLGQKMKLCSLM